MTETPRISIVIALIVLAMISLVEATQQAAWEEIGTQGSPPEGGDTPLVFAMPDKGGEGQIGAFGGFVEAPDYTTTTQPDANAFFNNLYSFDIETATWSTIVPATADAPSERGFVCGGYHAGKDALYVFGGSTYANTFQNFSFFNDTWKFDFATLTWVDLTLSAAGPSNRAASGCAMIDDALYLFGGNLADFSSPNDLWKFNVVTETWSVIDPGDADPLNPISGGPAGRIQPNMGAIPGTDSFILLGGENFPGGLGNSPPVVLEDIWSYSVNTSAWKQLNPRFKPAIAHEFQGFAVTSNKYFLTQNGDAQGNITGADTCPWIPATPPFLPPGCLTPATPTDDVLFFKMNAEKWEEKPDLVGALPPTKRSGMVLVNDTVYLFGGYGWERNVTNPDGYGKMPNLATFKLKLKNKYL